MLSEDPKFISKELEKIYNEMSFEERQKVVEMLADPIKFQKNYSELQNVFFTKPPVSEDEFLDWKNGWLPKHLSEMLFPEVKRAFKEMLDPIKNYKTIVNYGATRCFGLNTPILMVDGSIKFIQDIKENDCVMGNDGTSRIVLQTYSGNSDCFLIQQENGLDYVVNGEHRIVCKIKGRNRYIRADKWNSGIQGFSIDNKGRAGSIKVTPVGEQDFYGIEISDNNLFCLADGTVVMNTGKSVTERLLVVFIIIYIHRMRSVHDYLNIPTFPVIYLMSFKYDKAKQLLLKPVFDILESAPRYVKVIRRERVKEEQAKYGPDKIVWSEAALTGEITLASGLQIYLGNKNPDEGIGGDIISVFLSELSYFINQAGATEEEVYELFTNVSDRIAATFPQNPAKVSFAYIDTSANNADSLIENYILTDLVKKESTYFQSLKQWDVKTEERVPIYSKTKETFKVITGNGSFPIKIQATEADIKNVPADLVMDIPIDYLDRFLRQPSKSIRDIAGKPTTSDSKFIQNGQLIKRIFDNTSLHNIEACLIIDTSEEPKDLVWNKINDQFFTQYDGENYIIKRAPNEQRFIGLDVAYSHKGDLFGFTMGHFEWSTTKNSNVWVSDMSFGFGPGKEGINQDAIRYFILDLVDKGGISLSNIFLDSFESGSMEQFFKRYGLPFTKQSLDKNADGYDYLLTQLMGDLIKVGKNIFLKNNLICLEDKISDKTKKKIRKIDHPKGPTNNVYNGSWNSSDCGYYAKDVSDSLAQALFGAHQTDDQYQPSAIYEDENMKAQKRKQTLSPDIDVIAEEDEESMYEKLGAYVVYDSFV